MLRQRGTFYWKSLMLVLVAICLPAALIGISIYYVGAHTIVRELNGAHKIQTTQSIQRFDDYLSNLENYCALLAFHPGVDSSLNRLDYAQQYQDTKNLFKSLMLMKGSNPLIKDVALYLKDSNRIISDYLGVRALQTAKDRQLASSLLNTDKLTFMTDLQLDALTEPAKVVAIKLSDTNGRAPFGAFFIFIDQSMLDRLVRHSATGGGSAFLMDDSGRLVTNDSAADPALQRTLKDTILRGESTADTFVYKYGGEQYSVSHQELSRLGRKWIFVSATPLSQITAPVTSLSRMILVISSCGLIVVLLIAWIASNRVYRPIQRLVGRLQHAKDNDGALGNEIARIETEWEREIEKRIALQTRIEKSMPSLREMFLLQFFQGKYCSLTEEDIAGRLNQYGWNVGGCKFAFLVLQLHGTDRLERMTDKDSQLIAFAAANILEELTEAHIGQGQVIPFHDASNAALLVLPPHQAYDEARQQVTGFARTVMTTVHKLLRLQVTVAVSRIKDSILATPEILEEARKALRYRKISDNIQIVDVHELLLRGKESVQFPFALEKELIHDLRMGLEEQAIVHLRQFLATLQNDGGTELWIGQGMMKLLGSIHEAVLKSEIHPSALFHGEHLYDDLLQIKDPEQMLAWFQRKVIRPFIEQVPKSYNSQMKQTVEDVLEQIHELYLAADISLDYFAERSGISVYKLSRAFKQVTGENFIDYVTRLRLAKCKDLLVSTHLKVNEIADMLHYNAPYLVRIFKKYEGMTPGQYREKHAEVRPSGTN